MNELFGDMKTDEEKSAFFLSGRGYETGVIAVAIQNDVAMAYHRCAQYKKELAALQAERERWKRGSEIRDEQNQDLHSFIMELKAECEKLRKAIRRLCNIYVVDDYYDGKLREERLESAVNQAIEAAIQEPNHDNQ